MIPLRSRSDSLTFTPRLSAIGSETNFSRSPIVIEDQFPRVEITDGDVDQIEVVGDLIRHVESMEAKSRPSAW
jgi:hypothetical protein